MQDNVQGLEYRDALLITFYFVVQGISFPRKGPTLIIEKLYFKKLFGRGRLFVFYAT